MIFAISDKETLRAHYIGIHDDEAAAWRIFLGWPAPDEIETAKRTFICENVVCFPIATWKQRIRA